MSPIINAPFLPVSAMVEDVPMSRTHQYRKVMKPLLERKRRARINKCLDELKDLMVYALQSEGESITKLEKADVLEITVRHLQKLKRQKMLRASPSLDLDRFKAGFSSCASEVGRCLASIPGVDIHLGSSIMTHLGASFTSLERQQSSASPLTINPAVHAPSQQQHPLPMSPTSDGGYNSGRDSPISVGAPEDNKKSEDKVWRPFI